MLLQAESEHHCVFISNAHDFVPCFLTYVFPNFCLHWTINYTEVPSLIYLSFPRSRLVPIISPYSVNITGIFLEWVVPTDGYSMDAKWVPVPKRKAPSKGHDEFCYALWMSIKHYLTDTVLFNRGGCGYSILHNYIKDPPNQWWKQCYRILLCVCEQLHLIPHSSHFGHAVPYRDKNQNQNNNEINQNNNQTKHFHSGAQVKIILIASHY